MGRAKLHVVPNTQVASDAESPVSKPVRKSAPKTTAKKPSLSRIADLMQRDVASCRPYEPLNTVGRLMWDRDVGVVVIVDEQLRPLSMITDRDLAMAAYTQGATLANIGVRSCMSQRLVTCLEDATASDALELMQQNRVRRLPVVDLTGKLVGVIGFGDLSKAASNKKLKTGLKVMDLAGTLSKILE
jgi:CBS domain-containing protein